MIAGEEQPVAAAAAAGHSWTGDASHCLFRKTEFPGDSEWQTALIEPALFCDYAKAAICPCALILSIADLTGDSRHDNEASWTAVCCVGDVGSCLITAPLLFCLDQFGVRAYDRYRGHDVPVNETLKQHLAMPAPYMIAQRQPQPYEQAALAWGRSFFGAKAAAEEEEDDDLNPNMPGWIQDSNGYAPSTKTSEDWWPAEWCRFYAIEALYSTFVQRQCCWADDMPRLPLCFSLMVMLAYPCTVCPVAIWMRRQTIDRAHLHEGWPKSVAATCCCLPCGLVQTQKELERFRSPGH